MSSRNGSVVNGRTVDISNLEREIKQDVATYRQYKAEDGMKKRAIHSSKDYDEFRNFVSVSQLKPASGRDVSSLFSGASGSAPRGNMVRSSKVQGGRGTIGGFDDVVQRRKDATNPSFPMAKLGSNLKSLSLGKVSTAKSEGWIRNAGAGTAKSSREAHDFLREWKEHCKTAKETLLFLTLMKDTNGSFESKLVLQPDLTCEAYFSTDIDSEILGDIVEALHLLTSLKNNDDNPFEENTSASGSNHYHFSVVSGMPDLVSSDSAVLSFTSAWLKALVSCGRYDLSVSFLTQEKQLKLEELRGIMKTSRIDGVGTSPVHQCMPGSS